MQLLQSWKESLLIFEPSNFKLFLIVTVKLIWETYKILFKYFWLVIMFYILSLRFQRGTGLVFSVKIALNIVIIFAIFLTVRLSVSIKNLAYFNEKFRNYFIPFMLGLSCFVCFWFLLLLFDSWIASLIWDLNLSLTLGFFVLLPVAVFFFLFLLDSDGRIQFLVSSLIRAIKMTLYNYPFCFIVYGIIFVLSFLLRYRMPGVDFDALMILSLPIPICVFSNLYIKQVHEHFDLYFGKKS